MYLYEYVVLYFIHVQALLSGDMDMLFDVIDQPTAHASVGQHYSHAYLASAKPTLYKFYNITRCSHLIWRLRG